MSLKRSLLALAACLLNTSAFAATVAGETRSYTHSCGYYSSTAADAVVSYHDSDLPEGTSVELIYGLEGEEVLGGGDHMVRTRIEWREERRVALASADASTWSVTLNAVTHGRSSPVYYDALNFVFKISRPDGSVSYDNGTDTAWGFYKLKFARATECTSPGVELPAFVGAVITTVARN